MLAIALFGFIYLQTLTRAIQIRVKTEVYVRDQILKRNFLASARKDSKASAVTVSADNITMFVFIQQFLDFNIYS